MKLLRVFEWPVKVQLSALAATVLVPAAIVAALLLRMQWNSSLERAYSRSEVLARAIANDLDGMWRDHEDVLRELADDSLRRNITLQGCGPLFTSYDNLRTDIEGITIRAPDGALICSTLPNVLKQLPDSLDEMLEHSREAQGLYVSDVLYSSNDNRYLATLSFPIIDDSGELKGLIFARMNFSEFSERLLSQVQEDVLVNIFDSNFTLALTSWPDQTMVGQKITEKARAAFTEEAIGRFHAVDKSGATRIGASTVTQRAGWKVNVSFEDAKILSSFRQALGVTAITVVLLSALIGWVVWKLATGISKPITVLAHVSKAIANRRSVLGDVFSLPQEIKSAAAYSTLQGSDELAVIGRALERMIGQIEIEQHELALSRERYIRILEASPLACAVVKHGQITYANGVFAKLCNTPNPLNHAISSLVLVLQPEDSDASIDLNQWWVPPAKAVIAPASITRELILKAPDREPIRILAYPAYLGGNTDEILISCLDVTEASRARELQKLHTAVWRQSHEFMVITDLNGVIVDINPAGAEFLGYGRDELLGKMLGQMVGTDRSPDDVAAAKAHADTSGLSESDEHITSHSGHRLKVKTKLVALRDQKGRTQARLAIARDVTQEELRIAALSQYSQLFDSALNPIVTLDADGRILLANPAVYKTFEYNDGELIGASIEALLPKDPNKDKKVNADSRVDVLAFMNTTDSTASADDLKVVVGRTKSGRELKLQISASVSEGNKVTAIMSDVTTVETLRSQLHQSDKLASIGQLTGGLAHDINNTLAVVVSAAEIINETADKTTRIPAMAQRIVRAVHSSADLIRRLLVFSRKAPIAPANIKIGAILADTAATLSRTLGRRIHIEMKIADNVAPISVDRSMLESCILNLSINARDAMPDGGTLTFEVSTEAGEGGGTVVLAVSDTGVGMADDVIERIFDPFFTTKARGQGTGLGLSMVYGFVQQSGGHIAVQSAVGEGTTFLLRFPAASEIRNTTTNANANAADQLERLQGFKVLVIDDNDDVRDALVDQLTMIGCEAVEASNVTEAFDIIEADDAIDFILSDYDLGPGGNALELLKRLETDGYEIPGAIVSGYLSTPAEGIETYGWVSLSKPVHMAALVQTLLHAMDA